MSWENAIIGIALGVIIYYYFRVFPYLLDNFEKNEIRK